MSMVVLHPWQNMSMTKLPIHIGFIYNKILLKLNFSFFQNIIFFTLIILGKIIEDQPFLCPCLWQYGQSVRDQNYQQEADSQGHQHPSRQQLLLQADWLGHLAFRKTNSQFKFFIQEKLPAVKLCGVFTCPFD